MIERLPPAFPQVVLPAFLLLAVGWIVRRRGVFGPEAVRALSRLVVDFCFPALAFVGIARTVAAHGLRPGGAALALAVVLFGVAAVAGAGLARLAPAGRRPTAAFLVAMPNWLFLPLPIAPALWGPAAEGTVLWMNLAFQLAIWSIGIALLTSGPSRVTIRDRVVLVAGNPAFLSSVGAIVVATAWPALPTLLADGYRAGSAAGWSLAIMLRAVQLLGGLTIPLSFVVMGAQLASARLHPRAWSRDLLLVVAGRLVVAPAVFAVLLRFLSGRIGEDMAGTALLVAAMPCAISCGSIVERFRGDEELTAQAVVLTTVASVATVPLLLKLAGFL